MDDYSFDNGGVSSTFGFGGYSLSDYGAIDPGQVAMHLETNESQNRGVTPQFILVDVHDRDRSEAEGRPCFKQVEVVLLRVAGDRYNVTSHPVDEAMKRRFRAQYENWKLNRDGAELIEGTPLKQWPVINSAQAKELEALNVFNVEGLAEIADSNLNRSPELRGLRDKARVWLRQAKDGAEALRLQAELDREREERSSMREQMAAMMAKIEELSASRGKKHVKDEAA